MKKYEQKVLLYEEEYQKGLYFFSRNTNKLYDKFKISFFLNYINLMKVFGFIFVFKEFIIQFKRKLKYFPQRQSVAYLVYSLDKGGLEQVVYNIVTYSKSSSPYILIVGDRYGTYGLRLRSLGYYVYLLNDNYETFEKIAKRLKFKVLNSHFCVWHLDKVASLGIKIIYTVHSSYTWINGPDLDYRISMYKYVNKFIAVSSSTKEFFAKKFKINKNKIIVIQNGFDIRKGKLFDSPRKKQLKSSGRSFAFLNVGSFSPIKNQLLLLSAFKKVKKDFPYVSLWLVGNIHSEEYYLKIRQYITKNSLERNVFIYKFMERDELFDLYLRSNCFVLSSIQEGAPNVLLESIYMRIPTISTDVGNAKELLNNIGIIVKNSYEDLNEVTIDDLTNIAMKTNQKNTQELYRAMKEVVQNESLWKERATLGRKLIERNYSIDSTVRSYEEVFID